MKSTSKTVLFTTASDGRKTIQWPVAVFNDQASAKSFAAFLRLAVKAGNVDVVKVLDPSVKLTEEGKLHANMKYSVIDLPYAPTPELPEDEPESAETPSS